MSLFFQAEDGIRDLVRSRGLGDVYKRQSDDRVSDIAKTRPQFLLLGSRLLQVLGLERLESLSLIHI